MTPPRRTAAEASDDGDGRTERSGTVQPIADGRPTDRPVSAVLALVTLVAALSAIAGLAGAACGIATAVVWYAAGTPYAVGIGHVALVGLFPAGIDPTSLALAEVGFGALVLASAPRRTTRVPVRYAVTAAASAGTLGGIAWLVLGPGGWPIWMAAVATLAALACGVYGLHRYGLVFVLDRDGRANGSQSEGREPTADGPSTPDADPTADVDTHS
ncbi:hypothetical protein [Natrinema sp. 74]|uniref:hypothetical protein n=1 Tax=Natrinema sp. 74 TaxID=3384159 RepID=UPI0038D42B66